MGAQVYFNKMETLYCSVPPPVKISHRQHSVTKTKLTRTKRNLFGAVKSDEVKQIYVAQMLLQEEEKKQKWNFDFRHGIPLNGKMQWEQVNRVPVVPIWSTQAAHVLTIANSSGVKRTSSVSSEDCVSSEELLDERAERANRDIGVDVDSHDESQSSTPSTLSPVQGEDAVQILPSPTQRTVSPKPSSSKGSKMRQPQITEYMKERKRRLSSNVPVEKISAKKVRMMLATPENGVGQQQQPEEVATSSAN
ncbi:uncharacterized protein LOC128708681 [Anopheles marshallii]|uniref:uncharacterized protein LOC128708681 n=1 Tax=Anopheles marshallii TaxID=1521116 RepID=UPI00237A2E10|nr:uncharacterized protein LOC128708681 [Anopheles marshallii]